jgi:TATA-box binding protein (TBP) (component of TFIID and TFIIIB)
MTADRLAWLMDDIREQLEGSSCPGRLVAKICMAMGVTGVDVKNLVLSGDVGHKVSLLTVLNGLLQTPNVWATYEPEITRA